MPKGWIRAYTKERSTLGLRDTDREQRDKRARFRERFRTSLYESADTESPVVSTLRWGQVVDLPERLSKQPMTKVVVGDRAGFVWTDHVVELAYVCRQRRAGAERLKGELVPASGGKKVELLWGDCVQILERGPEKSRVRARGICGEMHNSDLTSDALLEVYFIDVGQGDGILVRTPDARHLLVDGGLERRKQVTGKSAADFVDWKFFVDYGDFRVRLDSMTASHSDNDHYGGLHDLVRTASAADRELDCLGTDIAVLHHPGLSRWENRSNAVPRHADGLGPTSTDGSSFTRLLNDRADAESAIVNGAADEFSGPWKWFVRDVLENGRGTKFKRVGVAADALKAGKPLPAFWPRRAAAQFRYLGRLRWSATDARGSRISGAKR